MADANQRVEQAPVEAAEEEEVVLDAAGVYYRELNEHAFSLGRELAQVDVAV